MLLDEKWCRECGGPCTRSKQHVPEQPDDSPLCAPCWYNQAHPETQLLDTAQLDDLQDGNQRDDHLVGRLIDWHSKIVPLVKLNNGGIYAEVHLTCRCGKESEPFYAGSGLHHGAWPYIHDANGKYLANIRDQGWRCEEHASK